jgi:DNA polymerase I
MAKPKRPTLVLFDGNAIVHRGFHALPPLTSPSGEQTNAVYGFATIVLGALQALKPEFAVVAWDASETVTFRTGLSAEYKAHRVATDPELKAQFPRVRELIETLGIVYLEAPGYEADDIIATLAKKFEPTHRVVIVTGDMDALQLVSDHVSVAMMKRGFTELADYTPQGVVDRYGLTPAQIVDYKALRGDASDNIPGVPGIGEKTAQLLLQEFETLDGVYERLDEVPERWRTKLEAGRESAYLSRELATAVTDLPLEFELDAAQVGDYDRDRALELFRDLGFKSLLAKLPPTTRETVSERAERTRTVETILVDTEEKLAELARLLESSKLFAFDTETTSLDARSAELVGISVAVEAGRAYYVPVGHQIGDQPPKERVMEVFKRVLASDALKVAHNWKFDLVVCESLGLALEGPYLDTLLAAYLLQPGSRSFSLAELAFQEFSEEMQPISELIGTGRSQITFAEVPIPAAAAYSAHDADITLRLYHAFVPRLKEEGLDRVLEEIELPLVPILAAMERRGIRIDSKYLDKLSVEIQVEIERLEKHICGLAGCEFNINSPAQLAEVLYERLGLGSAGIKRGKTGYSTAASELEKLKGLHPIIEEIGTYRELVKLKNTYVDALPDLADAEGRVHTDYSQTVAATGRLSSSNPNLQNIPIRTELGRRVRRAFVASRSQTLLAIDYSQIELRIVAHLAGEEGLTEAFRQGKDIHTETAAKVAGVAPEKVTKEMRYAAKAVNFGIMYGLSPHGLSQGTGMSREEATAFIEGYFQLYPGIKRFMEETKEQAREQGYVETLLGRRRYLPEITSSNFAVRGAAERMAINMPVQGTAADIMKLAMIKLDPLLPDDVAMLLQVHDELVFELPPARLEAAADLIRGVMSSAYKLDVPLEVEARSGENWAQMKELP